jgi:hypothetical protein
MAAYGLPSRVIADRLNLTEDELETLHGHEIELAKIEMNAKIGAALFRQAMRGSLSAIIFWLKTRAGWSERVHAPEEAPEKPPPEAPPPGGYAKIMLPCNARDYCYKSGPKQRLAAFKKIHEELIQEATRRGMDLNFHRPANVKLVPLQGLYGWAHKKRDGSED